jgi:plasmid stabilization system protein ParE
MRKEARYLRARNPQAAQAFRRAMREANRLLSQQPRAGVHGMIPDARILVLPSGYLISYILAFERDGETVRAVQIFAIRHGRQADARAPED